MRREAAMCAGAIISNFILPPRSRRITSEFIWPDLKNKGKKISKKRSKRRSDFFDLDDEFEADFQRFKVDDGFANVKPFVFTATTKPVDSPATVFASTGKLVCSWRPLHLVGVAHRPRFTASLIR